jgi:hypothetical protein
MDGLDVAVGLLRLGLGFVRIARADRKGRRPCSSGAECRTLLSLDDPKLGQAAA